MTRLHALWLVLFVLPAALATPGHAQDPTLLRPQLLRPGGSAPLEHRFVLGPRERRRTELTLQRGGRVHAQAIWAGGARLEMALLDAATRTVHARAAGQSPLVLQFDVTDPQLRRDRQLQLVLVNRDASAPAQGVLLVEHPGLVTPASGEVAAADAPPPNAAPTIRLLPDGTIETRSPDGRVIHQQIDGTCWRVVHPPNLPGACPIQVPGIKLAELPGGLFSDQEFNGWLGDVLAPILLEGIRTLANNEQSVENFISQEDGMNLQGQVDRRLEALNRLHEALARAQSPR